MEIKMTEKLYDSGRMDVGGQRARVIVTKTAKGITVKHESLYSDERTYTEFFRDGNYPTLPENWEAVINEYMTTAADVFVHDLGGYDADRITQ